MTDKGEHYLILSPSQYSCLQTTIVDTRARGSSVDVAVEAGLRSVGLTDEDIASSRYRKTTIVVDAGMEPAALGSARL